MRRWTVGLAASLGAVALFSVAAILWRIEPLLPARGASTCFAADYQRPQPAWLSTARPEQRTPALVETLRVKLDFPEWEEPYRSEFGGYDWRYSLLIDATLVGGEKLHSAAICEWTDDAMARVIPMLGCYIDCDGGGVEVWRVPGRQGVSVHFQPGQRLRMSHGCGGGGSAYMSGDAASLTLITHAVPATDCAE